MFLDGHPSPKSLLRKVKDIGFLRSELRFAKNHRLLTSLFMPLSASSPPKKLHKTPGLSPFLAPQTFIRIAPSFETEAGRAAGRSRCEAWRWMEIGEVGTGGFEAS